MKHTNLFDEVEAYTDFTLWDEVKFWCAVIVITAVVVILLAEITGLVDGFFAWLTN